MVLSYQFTVNQYSSKLLIMLGSKDNRYVMFSNFNQGAIFIKNTYFYRRTITEYDTFHSNIS